MSESDSSSDPGPDTRAGSIDLIVEGILRNLEWQDLMNCRHVNLLWKQIATPLFRPSLYFKYHKNPPCYRDKNDRPLTALIQHSVHFPNISFYTSFTFQGGDMRSGDAVAFFNVMGASVKTLTIIPGCVYYTRYLFNLTTILNHTPNLETLIINGLSRRDRYYCSDATVQLPKLKYIQIASRFNATFTPCITMLLNGAPNLVRLDGVWNLEDLEPIVTMDKMHTIISWCPIGYDLEDPPYGFFHDPFPEGLIQLMAATEDGLTLNELVVYVGETNLRRGGLAIVDANTLCACYVNLLAKNSIQKLILKCSKYPVGYEFPLNMYSVKELVLIHRRKWQRRHFPRNIDLHLTFPQLHTLSFYCPLYDDPNHGPWRTCFPLSEEYGNFDQILPTVRTLNLRKFGEYECTTIMLRKMKKICPNVQNLEIRLKGSYTQKRYLWELFGAWRHLRKLSIVLEGYGPYGAKKGDLDRVFTGNDPTFLENLNNDQSLTEAEKLERAEDERYVLWIGNMTALIQLDVIYEISHGSNNWLVNDTIIPFTSLSGKYGFALMPYLKVRLHYLTCECCADSAEQRNGLHSIRSVATIIRLNHQL